MTVLTGFYGRTDISTCCVRVQASLCANTACSLTNILSNLQESCNLKNSISGGLIVILNRSSDPCVNIIKYLIFTYISM